MPPLNLAATPEGVRRSGQAAAAARKMASQAQTSAAGCDCQRLTGNAAEPPAGSSRPAAISTAPAPVSHFMSASPMRRSTRTSIAATA